MVWTLLMIGCTPGERKGSQTDEARPAAGQGAELAEARDPASSEGAHAARPETDSRPVVLFVGTSLTAGLGLPEDEAFPGVIARRIAEARLPHRVVNAGISGETSAGAVSRIEWLVRQPFDLLVLETGANDMLRGLPPTVTEAKIQEFIDRVRERRPEARIVLAGMRALPNLGAEYALAFEPIYPRLAAINDLPLIPFLLEGVAGEPDLNQADGVHPTAAGQRLVADQVWEVLLPLLRDSAR